MIPLPPTTTSTYTLFPYTTLFRSGRVPFQKGSFYSRNKLLSQFSQGGRIMFRKWTSFLLMVCFLWGSASSAAYAEESERLAEDSGLAPLFGRSEEHTSELPSLMRNSYAVFCLTKKTYHQTQY